jgi:vacuolar-type H+-ATPase subunit I/STV1
MKFNIETFDGMSRSAFELLQHCSTIESLITQIESSFRMIRMILEQIPEESRQRLVASIQAFRDTFDQFVNEFASKKEEIMNFLNSAKEHIELMIRHSESASSLESKIQYVGSSLSMALLHQRCIASVLLSIQTKLTDNQTNITNLMESLKCIIEEYVRTQSERQIEFPTTTQIDSILHVMSSISPRFELYRQSDDSPIARTYEQNLFDARMKKGLDMIHAMIANQNTQGLRKVCAYLDVLLKRCYERLP